MFWNLFPMVFRATIRGNKITRYEACFEQATGQPSAEVFMQITCISPNTLLFDGYYRAIPIPSIDPIYSIRRAGIYCDTSEVIDHMLENNRR